MVSTAISIAQDLVDNTQPFDELRRRSQINEAAEAADAPYSPSAFLPPCLFPDLESGKVITSSYIGHGVRSHGPSASVNKLAAMNCEFVAGDDSILTPEDQGKYTIPN